MNDKRNLAATFCLLILMLLPCVSAYASKQGSVTVYVKDKDGKVVSSAAGSVVRDRVIQTNCRIIARWLDELENSLLVETGNGSMWVIDRVLFNDCRKNIIRIKIEPVPKTPGPPKTVTASKQESYESVPPPHIILPVEKPSPPPPPIAEMLLQAGTVHFNAGKYTDATENFREAVKLRPGFAEAYVNLGLAYYRLGRYQEAAVAYHQALQLTPGSLPLYHKLSTLHIMLGEYATAADILRQALALDPRNAVTHFNLGISYFLNNQVDTAYQEYAILKDIDINYANRLFDLLYP
jgi:tetratricopeptide (TPR) repeat protein